MKHKPRKIPIITKRIVINVFVAGTLLCAALFAVGALSFSFDLNLLYVSIVEPPDYTHITYVFNQVNKNGKLNEYPQRLTHNKQRSCV